jgi:hypothetical protein
MTSPTVFRPFRAQRGVVPRAAKFVMAPIVGTLGRMTDQTPPPDQPTPPPATGGSEGVESGETAPPPPPPPADTAVGTAPPPPPLPPKKSRMGLIIGVVAGLVVLAIIAAVVVIVFVAKGEDKHSITTPATAAGMKRDKAKETELKTQLLAVEKQFKTQSKKVTYVKSALYTQDDTKRGPKGFLLFLGAKVKLSEKNPTTFVKEFTKFATTNQLTVSKVAAGKGGGKALCASSKGAAAQRNVICAWATKDSTGELLPSVPGYTAKKLSKIMLDLRADVEKTE